MKCEKQAQNHAYQSWFFFAEEHNAQDSPIRLYLFGGIKIKEKGRNNLAYLDEGRERRI